jgi:hypothetical protein
VRLSSSEQNLPGLMQAFAEANGAQNWPSLGSFPPAGGDDASPPAAPPPASEAASRRVIGRGQGVAVLGA